MKEDLENVTKKCKNKKSLARIEAPNSGKLRHQGGPSPLGMKIFFLVTVMLAETLDRKQFIVNPMQEMTIWGTQIIMDIERTIMQIIDLEMLKGLLIETTIHLTR